MDKKLLVMLACPLCQGELLQKQAELVCCFDRLAYPIRDGIPVMLEQEARALTLEEKEAL
ncbi:MAG: Trm112 family protein [Gammaproteobacteria bacterium]|nr:Trm112 family protein [Gammaproteobacteria bacterium]